MRHFIDRLFDFLNDNIFWIFITVLVLSGAICSERAYAAQACIDHQVKPGDSLSKLAQHYLNDHNRWPEIQRHNEVRGTTIHVGDMLEVCTEYQDINWQESCGNILNKRLKQLRLSEDKLDPGSRELWLSLVKGINEAARHIEFQYSVDLDPYDRLELCREAITTIEHESYYQYLIGSVGELGLYQFRVSTAEETLAFYESKPRKTRTVVAMLAADNTSTYIFALHFYRLKDRYQSRWMAWKRYNGNGEHAEAYADRIMKRYKEIRALGI